MNPIELLFCLLALSAFCLALSFYVEMRGTPKAGTATPRRRESSVYYGDTFGAPRSFN